MDTIRQNLRFILNEKGIKQKSLAQKADIPEKTLSAMLNGRREIHHNEIISICNALSITPNDLYGVKKSAWGWCIERKIWKWNSAKKVLENVVWRRNEELHWLLGFIHPHKRWCQSKFMSSTMGSISNGDWAILRY